MKPVTTDLRFHFRLKGPFEKSPPFWIGVYVHPDRDALQAALPNAPCKIQAGFEYLALRGNALPVRDRRRCFIGDVHFYRDGVSAGVVAHEMLHAAVHLARAARLRALRQPDEEFLCIAHGRFVQGFWNWWRELPAGIFKEETR